MTAGKSQPKAYKYLSPDNIDLPEDTVVLSKLQLEVTSKPTVVKWSPSFASPLSEF